MSGKIQVKFTCPLMCRCVRSQIQSKLEVPLHDALSLLNVCVTRVTSPGWVVPSSGESEVLM